MRVQALHAPLHEHRFRGVIEENYYSHRHFRFHLTHRQTTRLMALFMAVLDDGAVGGGGGGGEAMVLPSSAPYAHPPALPGGGGGGAVCEGGGEGEAAGVAQNVVDSGVESLDYPPGFPRRDRGGGGRGFWPLSIQGRYPLFRQTDRQT